MRLKPNEIKIGIMVVGCLIGFVFITLKVGNFGLYHGYHLFVEMKDVAGLEDSAPVKLNGVDVGLVKKVTINYTPEDTNLILDLWIEEGTKISPQAQIGVKTMGLMGEKYIAITQKDANSVVSPGTTLKGSNGADMDELMKQANGLVSQLQLLLVDLRSVAGNVDGILTDNRENLHNIVLYVEGLSRNFDELSVDLKKNPWKLLFKSSSK